MGELSARRTPARPVPTPEQQRAADPARSVWVTASAGTGKTRVLADRVLRLLLAGAEPERILCLTFTKAGAAEMVTRIQNDLARFAAADADALAGELKALLGRRPRAHELEAAPALLPRILDLPAGLAVMTIHSFCQQLLSRFPLEAGVVPHFEVLEARDAGEVLREALDAVLEDPAIDLDHALGTLAVLVGEAGFRDGLDALRQSKLRLGRAFHRYGGADGLIGALARVLKVDPEASLEQLKQAYCANAAISPGLAAACRALEAGQKKDRARGTTLAAWLNARLEDRVRLLEDYRGVFLTTKDEPFKDLATKAVREAAPAALEALEAELARLQAFMDRSRAIEVFERSRALITVGAAVLEAYETRKRARAALDFDDLIERTNDLLAQDGIAPWIQYKLDQRIDHLLVDEGQDTSPEQWAIIEAVCADFFSGESAHQGHRTLFVVGDEKQSIFSFQGADLDTFAAVRRRLRERAAAARLPWHEEPLNRSFRTVEAVLEAVDLVFADPAAGAGLSADGAAISHQSGRPDLPGTVELWPLIEVPRESEPEGWHLPDRPERPANAERDLADRIAGQIATWLKRGTALPSTGQPIRPGDVMVVLPRRGLVQDFLIRELKSQGVPVAGADRLRLTDEIAVADLIALGDALLLPEDDLTLAALLKSPLFGLGEGQLFELAWNRSGRLITRLRERAADDPACRVALERFEELRARADFMPPYEFYGRLLGEGGDRRRLLARLGPAAGDAIEAFLGQALAYERSHPPSLQGFLHWLRQDTTELIRDPDRPRDEVRVLTVHGAKGLEAPIVIVADAGFVPEVKDRLLWLQPDELPLWRVGRSRQDPISQGSHDEARAAQLHEQRRLLYVAMTRARDWLIVAGWRRRAQKETTWYDLIETALAAYPGIRRERRQGAPPDEPPALVLARTVQNQLPLVPPEVTVPLPRMPDHLRRAPAPEPQLRSPLSPSRLAEPEPPADSPLGAAARARFHRGLVIHRLLQTLPDLAPDQRPRAMARLLAEPAFDLAPAARDEITREVERLLRDPTFQALFGPGSRAEVPVVGTIGGQPVSGQIDRLVVQDREVLLVDYKTNRAAPARVDEVPELYVRQLAAYRRLLQDVFPGRAIRCGLLWTATPELMLLDDGLLEHHLERVLAAESG